MSYGFKGGKRSGKGKGRRPFKFSGQQRYDPRGSRALTSGQNKAYTFEYNLTPQTFISTNSNTKSIISVGGALPINGPTSGTPGAITAWPAGYSATTVDWGFGVVFSLQDLLFATSFTTMFDMYRIEEVNMEFQWLQSQATVGQAAAPTLNIAYDLDDAIAPVNVGDVVKHQGAQRHSFGDRNVVSYTIRPRVFTGTTGGGGGAVNGASMLSPYAWQNSANLTVPYYGFKCWLSDIPRAQVGQPDIEGQGFRITCHYKVAWKGLKMAR